MIWYRHWLELRKRFYICLGLTALSTILYPVFLKSSTDWYLQSGQVIQEFADHGYLLPRMGADAFFPWALHAYFSVFVGIIAPIPIALSNGRAAASYTLTLPFSRESLYGTRLVAGWITVGGLLAAQLVIHSIILDFAGGRVPFLAMAESSLLALLGASVIVALLSTLTIAGNLWITIAIGPLTFGLLQYGSVQIGDMISDPAPWQIGTALAAIAGLSALSFPLARRREY